MIRVNDEMRGVQNTPIYIWTHPWNLTKSIIPIILKHWILLLSSQSPQLNPLIAPSRLPVRLMFLPLTYPEISLSSLKPQKETLHQVSNPSLFIEVSLLLPCHWLNLDPTQRYWLPCSSLKWRLFSPFTYSRTRGQYWQTVGSWLSWPQTTSVLPPSQTPKRSTTWLHTLSTQSCEYHPSI